ncbi:MAG: right-handed parallel beta-helix repeat-containing protein [Bryobacteraceae bacterium]
MLAPKGSGSATAPIRLGAWGTGPLPVIQAGKEDEAALKLFNQEYWTIEDLEFSGGRPHGVFVSGAKGVLHGIHIKDIVVHNVSGDPKTKEDGLVVIASGTKQQHFDDVRIDGVTAYGTSEWAGILVAGVAHGYQPETSRNTNVVIRNSIVHDVTGDGIVLFETNNGRIENSIVWRTGMQGKETIGTPNAIWTWMCRNCTVRHNEAFLTDSPGVDGGAFDIDYGDDDNIVEGNYGHDTQGYCVAVFGAGWVTGNSIVRNNICAANGLSPRLARRQGAIYLATWNGGKIRGLDLSGNQIFWDPPLAAPAVVNIADLEGKGIFERNTIRSASPWIIRSNSSLLFDRNSYEYCGRGKTEWLYRNATWHGFREYQQHSGQDAHSRSTHVAEQTAPSSNIQKWSLIAVVSASAEAHDSRGEVAMMESVHAQFPEIQVKIVVDDQSIPDKNDRVNLRYDWNAGDIPVLFDDEQELHDLPVSRIPALLLVNLSGKPIWKHEGFTAPGKLGLLLRSFVTPEYAEMPSAQ